MKNVFLSFSLLRVLSRRIILLTFRRLWIITVVFPAATSPPPTWSHPTTRPTSPGTSLIPWVFLTCIQWGPSTNFHLPTQTTATRPRLPLVHPQRDLLWLWLAISPCLRWTHQCRSIQPVRSLITDRRTTVPARTWTCLLFRLEIWTASPRMNMIRTIIQRRNRKIPISSTIHPFPLPFLRISPIQDFLPSSRCLPPTNL